jgi:tetraacyldisaccharide 4'-kinase
MLRIDWSKIHRENTFSPLTPLLALSSSLYSLGVKLWFSNAQRRKKKSLPGFVVSIGNITAGGTGKTPAVRMLATWAAGEGYSAAVLSRGYGGRHGKKILEVSDGNEIYAGPAEAGDEPCLLARRLRGVPVITGRERYSAGLLAHGKHGTDFYILDDGFQHLDLERDLDLVLLDASSPFGNGHILPWGPLREPVDHLVRADAFIITRSGREPSCRKLVERLNARFPGKAVFQSDHVPKQIVFPHRNRAFGPESIRGRRAVAFAGIARPDLFRETLIDLGAEVVFFKGFEDHHAFRTGEIQDLLREKKRFGADCLLTTEKDWVRLEPLAPLDPDLGYLTVQFTLTTGGEAFYEMVKAKANKTR